MEEDLKQAWRDTNNALCSSPMELKKQSTTLDKLAQRYKRFACLSLCCIILSASFINPNILSRTGLWLPIIMIIYFMTASLMDWWLYYGIKSIDCISMSVSDVIEKAYFFRKRHFLFIAILFPIMIVVFSGLIYAAGGDKYLILGMVAGGAVGLVIGFRQFLCFLRDYRSLKR